MSNSALTIGKKAPSPAIVLWTGGKDSCLALYEAKLLGYQVTRLVTFVPREKEFLAHPLRFIKYQSEALGLSHYVMEITEPFKKNYEKAIRSLQERYAISTLITGDIAEVDGHANWIRECSKFVDVLTPLWGCDRLELLKRILSCRFKVIFSCVRKPWFTEDWIGTELTETSLEQLCVIHAKTGIDICGEQGEYHTLVIDGPLFRKRIHISGHSKRTKDSLMYMDIHDIVLHEKFGRCRKITADTSMRICSLIPSATEIVFALGMGNSLAGVSHECDYPPQAARLPKVTRSKIPAGLASREIDLQVRSTLEASGSLYELDLELLEKLQPDLILTQRLCDVCAVSFDLVEEAVKSLQSHPAILNLEPHSLEEILGNIRTVGSAIRCEAAAEALIGALERRIDAVRQKTKDLSSRPRVFCMEWVNPPYCGGHWMKELVEIAGGRDDLSQRDRPSYRIDWRRVLDFSPETIVLTCCGFSLDRCRQEGEILARYEGIHQLPAAKSGRIFATDGSSYFSRSGPRIVESLEILAHLIHPELFPAPPLEAAFALLSILPVANVGILIPQTMMRRELDFKL